MTKRERIKLLEKRMYALEKKIINTNLQNIDVDELHEMVLNIAQFNKQNTDAIIRLENTVPSQVTQETQISIQRAVDKAQSIRLTKIEEKQASIEEAFHNVHTRIGVIELGVHQRLCALEGSDPENQIPEPPRKRTDQELSIAYYEEILDKCARLFGLLAPNATSPVWPKRYNKIPNLKF